MAKKPKSVPKLDLAMAKSRPGVEHGENCRMMTLRKLEGTGITGVFDGETMIGWMLDKEIADYSMAFDLMSSAPDYSPPAVDVEVREKTEELMRDQNLSLAKAFRKALDSDPDLKRRYHAAHNVEG